MHQERKNKHEDDSAVPKGAKPAYLLDRTGSSTAKVLSNTIKQKRKEKVCRLLYLRSKRKILIRQANGMFLYLR
jgi:hypothetical protein